MAIRSVTRCRCGQVYRPVRSPIRSAARRPSAPWRSCRWCRRSAPRDSRAAGCRADRERGDPVQGRLDLRLGPALVEHRFDGEELREPRHRRAARHDVRVVAAADGVENMAQHGVLGRILRVRARSIPSGTFALGEVVVRTGHDGPAAGAAVGSAASRAVTRSMSAAAAARRPRMPSTTAVGAFSTNFGLPSFLLGVRRAPSAPRPDRGPAAPARRRRRSRPRCRARRARRRRAVRPRPWRSARTRRRARPAGASDRSAVAGPTASPADDPRGDPTAVRHPLLGAEPADLGDQLLQVRDPRRGGSVGRRAGLDRPGRDHDRLTAGEGRPQRLGDERDDRVQQPEKRVQDVPEDGPGALRGALVAQLRLGQLDVPVAELAPREVVERLAGLGELEVLQQRVDLLADLAQPAEDPAVGVGALGLRGQRPLDRRAVAQREPGGVPQLGA